MSHTATASKKVSLPTPAEARLDDRSRRAREERMAVTPFGGSVYEAETENDAYLVDLESGRCTCPDHVFRKVRCKHLARVAIEINEGRVPPPGTQFVECTHCGDRLIADEHDDGPYVCSICDFRPGDAVVDRETGDLLIVARVTDRRADEVVVPDHDTTVAEYPTNENYSPADHVVEVVYPLPANIRSDQIEPRHVRRYSFPISRLKRRGPSPDQAHLSDFSPDRVSSRSRTR